MYDWRNIRTSEKCVIGAALTSEKCKNGTTLELLRNVSESLDVNTFIKFYQVSHLSRLDYEIQLNFAEGLKIVISQKDTNSALNV